MGLSRDYLGTKDLADIIQGFPIWIVQFDPPDQIHENISIGLVEQLEAKVKITFLCTVGLSWDYLRIIEG